MKPVLAAMAAAALLLAACDRPTQPKTTTAPASSPASSGAGPSAATTPAPQTSPSATEKKDGSNPVQGQVDPKASEQHKDFQQPGDKAGPSSAETQPKSK